MVFLFALFYASFSWAQGITQITNFSDAGYWQGNGSFTSGGIDFSFYGDSTSAVDPDSMEVYISNGNFSIDFYNDKHLKNWIKVVIENYDSLGVVNVDVYAQDAASSYTISSVGVPDTFFFDAQKNFPFTQLMFNGNSFSIFEVEYNFAPFDFFLEKDSVCPGEMVKADINIPDVQNVKWLPGDGSPAINNFHFEHIYPNAGNYNITCIVNFFDQSTDTIVKQVSVLNNLVPKPNFWVRYSGSACPGDPVSFGIDKDYLNYNWNFGDGSPNEQTRNPAHAFSLIGQYNVVLTVTNSCGNSGSDSILINIDNNTPAIADFNIWNPDACPNEPVFFEAMNSGTFIWNFGDGTKGFTPQIEHAFPDTGNYVVTLINQNSCGYSDTITKEIPIMLHPERTSGNYPEAAIKTGYGDNYYIQVCPGQPVAFANYTHLEPGETMYWDFGDSTAISKEFEPVHIYQNPGYYNARLVIENNCGSTQDFWLSIDVIDSLVPKVKLMATPLSICPGEAVYFWDENFDKSNGYSYDIIFGDGDSLFNIIKNTPNEPHVLAVHNYSNAQNYAFTLSAQNACGNTVSYTDTIRVSTDSTNVPFYYVQNTAEPDNGNIERWDKKFSETDAVLKVPVHWAQWDTTKNNNFFVAVWYGSVDLTQPNIPEPDGIAKVVGNGNTATVYVPMQNNIHSVGVAAFWSCSGSPDGEPSTKGAPIDTSTLMPIQSFPIQAGQITNIPKIELETWDGTCNLNWGIAQGDWSTDDLGGFNYVMHLWDGQYELEKHYTDGKVDFIERGYFDIWDSLFTFNPNFDEQMNTCTMYGDYIVNAMNGILSFTLNSDQCSTRSNIFVNKFHKLPPMFDQNGVCPGDPVFFQALGGSSYDWVFNTDTLKGSIVEYSFATPGDYTMNLYAMNNCGRKDTVYSYVHVADNIIADNWFETDKEVAFSGEEIFFHYGNIDNPVSANYTYIWKFGDGTTGDGPNPSHIYLEPGNYDVSLSVVNGCGPSPEFHKQITVLDKPACKAQFNWLDIGGDSIAFTNISIGDSANTVYTWNFGDGSTSNNFEPVHYYSNPGVYDVSLTVRDTVFNCVNIATFKVKVGVIDCYADFEFFINNQTNEVAFYDKSEGNIASWHWDFGDGYYSDMQNPVHTFAPGIYPVSLTIFNPTNGCQSTNVYEISVGQVDCYPEFSYYADSLTVEFYDESLGATGFYWDFGDGEIDTVPDPVHTYAQSGIYTVYYAIWNDSTGCQGDMIRDIQVLGGDSALCSVSYDYFVDSLTANFSISSNNNSFTDYYWDFGNGDYDTTANPSYTYPDGGIYSVCLYVYDSISGCQAEYCSDIPIATSAIACKADFSVRKGEAKGEMIFADKSIGEITNWSWDFGDNNFATDSVTSHIYQESGYYTVQLSVFDSISGCYSEIAKDVPIKLTDSTEVGCKADFSYFIDAANLKVSFKDEALGNITTWYWTFGDGNIDASQNPVHAYGFPGEYTITQYVFNQETGCTDQKSVKIYIGQKDCNLSADIGYMLDTGNVVTFKDKSIGTHNVSYWTFGDGKTADTTQIAHQYAAAGYYLVTLTVIDDSTGCDDHASAFIQVGTTNCKADFDYTVDVDSLKVTYINKSNNNSFNYWSFFNGHYSDDANPVFYYKVPGKHLTGLVIGDENGICWDYSEKELQVGEIKCDADFKATVNPNTLFTKFENKAQVKSTRLYWQFGDGSTSTMPNPSYRYSHPGYYLVSLYTYNDANDCMDYQEDLLLVGNEGDDCEADFFYQANAQTREVQFTDASKGTDLTYLWDFGDGSTSTEASPKHTFTDPGYKYVCLTVVNGKGIPNLTCKDVQVGDGCLAQFDFVVDSLSVSFKDKSFGDPVKWRWEFGDSTAIDTTQNPTHTYSKPGDYLVFFGVKNASGCANRTVQIISVGTESDTTFTADFAYEEDTTDAKPNSRGVAMFGSGKGDSPKAKWNFGDAQKRGWGENTTTLRPTYHYTVGEADTTVTVCLTIEDPVTNKSATACHDITLKGTGSSTSVQDLSDYADMNIYPNPAKDFTKLNYSLTRNMNIRISIYDVKGNRVKEILHQNRMAGTYSQDISLQDLASGTYFIEISAEQGKLSKQFVVKK